jgi:molybdopterin converting factor small subunit
MDNQASQSPSEDLRVHFSYWGLSGEASLATRSMHVAAGTTLGVFLDAASALAGIDLRAETARDGMRFVAINGAYCEMPRDLDRRLEDGDEVSLLPFVAGG